MKPGKITPVTRSEKAEGHNRPTGTGGKSLHPVPHTGDPDIIRDLPDPTFVIDKYGVVIAWNRAIENMTGIPAANMVGKGNYEYALPFYNERRPILIDIALLPDAAISPKYQNLSFEGRTVTATTVGARPKGRDIVLWGKASPLFDDEGTVTGAIETIRDITATTRLQEQNAANEERLKALLQNASDIIRIIDRDGTIVFDTAASERVLGYPPGFTLGKHPSAFIHPDDLAVVQREFAGVLEKSNTGVPTEFRIRKADGSYVWVESIGRNLFGVPGIDGIVVTTRFIEERKEAECALRESEEKYRAIFENSVTGIFQSTPAGRFMNVNRAMASMFGYPDPGTMIREITDISTQIYANPEARKEILRILDEQNTPEPVEIEFLHRDGHPFWASVTVRTVRNKEGAAVCYEGTLIDITKRKKAEEDLRIATEKYTKAFLAVPDAITVSDLVSGRFLEANDAAIRIFGFPRDELIGHSALALGIWPDKAARNALISRIKAEGKVVQFEVVERRKTGELFHASVTADTISIGSVRYLIATTRDISERKRAEERLRESEARYNSLFTDSYSVSLLIDPDTGRIVDANNAAARYYGYTREQLTRMGIFDLNRLPEEKVISHLLRAKGEREKHFFSTHYLADGNRRNVEIFSGPITVDKKPLFYSIIHDITDRRKAEDALRESEERYSSLFDNNYSVSLIIDPDDGRIVDANAAAVRYYGYSLEQLMRMGIYDLNRLPKEKVVGDLKNAKNKKEKHFFATHYSASGEKRNVEIFSGPITVHKKLLFYSIIHDVTERIKAEEALQESKDLYQTLAESGPDMIYLIDKEGYLRFVNSLGAKQFRQQPSDLIGKRLDEVFDPETARRHMAAIARTITTGESEISEVFESFPAHTIWIESRLNPVKDAAGEVKFVLGISSDITERKRAEQALRESEERYRTLIDQLPDYVIVHSEGTLLYVNPAAARDLGFATEELTGKNLTDFVLPEYHDVIQQSIALRMKGEIVLPYEVEITAKDGSKRTVLVHGAQILYGGRPASLNVLTDISIRKAAEEFMQRAKEELEDRVGERTWELTQANEQLAEEIRARNRAERMVKQSLDEKDLLLREIHHRVKNNLQIIASLLNLQSRYINDPKVLESIRDSQNRVRAMALVHERIYRSHEISTINLSEYLRYLINQLFRFYNIPQAQVAITLKIDEIPADIDTAIPIGLIINELVSNSLKHAFPDGRTGTIHVTGRQTAPDRLEFVYRDDGVGIPADFDWKNTTSLGLRLVKSLTEQLMGTVEMVRDGGTVYTINVKPRNTVKGKETEENHG